VRMDQKLPPGWRVKVSRSKNKAYCILCTPDFGSTWHWQVVSQHPVEIRAHEKHRISERDGEGETCMEQGDHM